MLLHSFQKLYIVFFILPLQAETKPQTAQEILENMTLTYSQVEYMKASFTKKEISTLLGTEEKSKGKLEYSKGKFRLELKGKNKSTLIKGKKKSWQIGEDGKVVEMENSKAVPSIFEAIFTDTKVWNKLESKFVEKPKKIAVIKVNPKGQILNIKSMTLKIDTEKRTLENLEYVDELNNKVEIDFSHIRFFENSQDDRFTYKK